MDGIEQILQVLATGEIGDGQRDALVRGIVRLDRMGHPERRYGIVHALGPELEAAVAWSDVALDHVLSIVHMCSAYSEGVKRLHDALYLFYISGRGEDLA